MTRIQAGRGMRMVAAAAWLAGGCTALRELPRGEYAAETERKNVRVETADGLRYEFDHVQFGADSLTGFRRRDTGGRFEEYDAFGMPLEGVSRLSVRRLDWVRTGLIGGAAVAAVLVAALRNGGGDEATGSDDPCPRCPD